MGPSARSTRWWRPWRSTGVSLSLGPVTSPPHGPLLAGVEPEGPRQRELPQLVADHRLGDVDGNVLAPVVDGDRVTDHVGDDRRPARPRLDDALLVLRVQLVDLPQQVLVDKRALLQAARHLAYLREPRVRR